MNNLPCKRKIINDPVYGLITVPNNLVFDIIEHPWFQRLRRIIQLGLTHYVYPSAVHTRYQHALGAMHLMTQAVEVLRSKGILISAEEEEGVLCAILLHDIGHGPYSHVLEQTIVKDLSHEDLSLMMMDSLNDFFNHRLDTANKIFRNDYPKKFLHQLVSSQLDMDRLDYLSRDSFFTGVAEGVINTDRIIKMLTVVDDQLVVEGKGIYSIEKFIISRRLMYWQVYLHKTVIAAEYMLVNILKRAKELASEDIPLFGSPVLHLFLYSNITIEHFLEDRKWIEDFARLDDYDILSAIKVWTSHRDPILSYLCKSLVDRHLYKVEIQNEPFDVQYLASLKEKTIAQFRLKEEEVSYFVVEGTVTNNAYNPEHDRIRIQFRNNELVDVSEASDQLNISVLSTPVSKYLLCYPKNLVT
ncbi:MAG: HD domain-containing protein [Bacteroidetes bacterium]|nr:MAG: HD domain-containing protein [Bacteroidota bacterium]